MDLSQLGDGATTPVNDGPSTAPRPISRRERLGEEAYAKIRAAELKYYQENKKKRSLCSMAARKKKPEHYNAVNADWREANRPHLRQTYKKFYAENKEARSQQAKEFRKNNPDKVREWQRRTVAKKPEHYKAVQKKWQDDHKEHNAKRNSAYAKKNRAKRTAQQGVYIRERRKRDPQYRLLFRMRSRMWDALQPQSAKKAARTMELLGCTGPQFRSHLEEQFKPGMSWENYGEYWQIDHISPLAAFDLTKPHIQRLAFHYSNCRPLESLANNLKADRVLQLHELLDL